MYGCPVQTPAAVVWTRCVSWLDGVKSDLNQVRLVRFRFVHVLSFFLDVP